MKPKGEPRKRPTQIKPIDLGPKRERIEWRKESLFRNWCCLSAADVHMHKN